MRCTTMGAPRFAHVAQLAVLLLGSSTVAAHGDGSVQLLRVSPGELHRCSSAARAAELTSDGMVTTTRCELQPGIYRDSIAYAGPARLEIVGSGPGTTVMDGSERVVQVAWERVTLPHLSNSSAVYKATLPPALRIKGIKQAFIDGAWISEARFPDTNLEKVFKKTSWADCGKGSEHGYCKDRPDAWSRLPHRNWTGALATMLLGTQYAVWTRSITKHGPGWFRYVGSLGPGPGSKGAAGPGQRYFLSGVLSALDHAGEWFIDETDWTVYVWTPDSSPPGDRFSVRVRDFCVDLAHSPAAAVSNLSMHACTFRVQNCTGCQVTDLNITYPSYQREFHLRDPTPFKGGPPPNTTLFHGSNSTLSRIALRYSNSAGIKVVGDNNVLSEMLILDTDWLGTLDYPPLEVGFGLDLDAAGGPDRGDEDDEATVTHGDDRSDERLQLLQSSGEDDAQRLGSGTVMYPRNTKGRNNTVTRVTVGRFGNSGIVTSQLSNVVSFCHVCECRHFITHTHRDRLVAIVAGEHTYALAPSDQLLVLPPQSTEDWWARTARVYTQTTA
jgi:hypothetical protein